MLWAAKLFGDLPMVVEAKLIEGMGRLAASPFWLRSAERTGGIPQRIT